ncbi:hypothetical protein [Desertivibrio insolitus]|uniref:hypothetical protein n=1 Tax=Herbiconiux sp. SYSU D00978 TaxID=2812562 RepID=UPI001A96E062|nr:hypothetical protein [Herbiconiux sp. SYSU D00978]
MTSDRDEGKTGATDDPGLTSSDPAAPPTWWTEIVSSSDDADEPAAPEQPTAPAARPVPLAPRPMPRESAPTPPPAVPPSSYPPVAPPAASPPPTMPPRSYPPAAAPAPSASPVPSATSAPAPSASAPSAPARPASPADDDATQALPTHHVPTPKAERLENQPPPPLLEHRIPFAGATPVSSAPTPPPARTAAVGDAAPADPDDDATHAMPTHHLPRPRAPRESDAAPVSNKSWSLSAGGAPTGPVPVFDSPQQPVPFTHPAIVEQQTRRSRRTDEADVAAASVPRSGRPPLTRSEVRLGLVAAALVVVIALIGLFILGTRLAPAPEVVSLPTPTVTALPVPPADDELPDAPLEPGTYSWNELAGGECLDPYTGPFAEEFTVVDCDESHPAQLVFRGAFLADDDPTAYPGVEALQQQIASLCSTPGAIDLDLASAYRDLQLEGSYPVTAEEWDAGYRDYYCFASRSSGEPLEGSIAAGGE